MKPMTISRYLTLCVTVFAATGCGRSDEAARQAVPATLPTRPVIPALPIDTITAAGLSNAFRAAAEHALPSLVQIRVVSRYDLPEDHPDADDARSLGTGSGFVIDSAGHIITNNHVVANAERVIVTLADGRDWEADIVGADPNTDVAVIRVDPGRTGALEPAEIADSDALRIGDWVLALGNPLGLNFTVTTGIVSAKGRNINILQDSANRQLEDFIQTDAAINPGNSGGPLVDLYGRVIGVNTAIQSQNGVFAGASFAIPINLAHKVADDLIRYGVVRRPRLGVEIQDVNSADAEVYRLPEIAGVEISSVTPGLPAELAGIERGDVVMSVNGAFVESVSNLQNRIARLQPGETVTLGIMRFGEPLEVRVELAQFQPVAPAQPIEPSNDRGLLGINARILTPGEASARGFPGGEVVYIEAVDRFGPAWAVGVRPGSALLEINGQPIESLDDIEHVARDLGPGQVASLVILRPEGSGTTPAPVVFNYRIW